MVKSFFVAVVCAITLVQPLSVEAHGRRRDPGPQVPIVLEVCHPKTGCPLLVSVCVPACCQGPPCVRHQHTLIGAGKTTFTWACGHEVTVRYTHGGGYRVVQ